MNSLPKSEMTSYFDNFIDGRWIKGDSYSPNVNPSDISETLGAYANADARDVDEAVSAARAALLNWSRTSPQFRHGILMRSAEELSKRREELGKILSREEGKTLTEGIGEITRAAQIMDYMAGEALRISGSYLNGLAPADQIEIVREPVGIVGVITPWNFPMAIPVWKIAAALAYGNCVLFKPSELTPGCAWELAALLDRAGLPRGVLNLTMGTGSVVGSALAEHPDVDAITFTGSVPTGRRVASACVKGSKLKKMQLEMGGKNPLIILDDADHEVAVRCAFIGGFSGTGQKCTASSRVIITAGIYERFVESFVNLLRKQNVGHALDPESTMGPVASERQLGINLEYIKIGMTEGAELLYGGRALERPTSGYYLEPTLFAGVSRDMRIAREEIFGPIVALVKAVDYEDAIDISNDTQFGLTAGICTSSLKHAVDFKLQSRVGVVKINQPTTGLDYHVPFGGLRDSSYGPREQGQYASEFFTNTKTIYISSN